MKKESVLVTPVLVDVPEKISTAFDKITPDTDYINQDLLDEYIKICEATYIDHIKWLFDLPDIYNQNDPKNEVDNANMASLLKQKSNIEMYMMPRLKDSINFLRNLKK